MRHGTDNYLAFDLGASSGRAVLGGLKDGRLRLREISRFPNGAVSLAGTLYWDVLSLWTHLMNALRLCARGGHRLSGIGVDTWGVDFGLIGRDGKLLANPVCYRDARTAGIEQVMARTFSPRAFYTHSGQDFNRITTLAQLLSLQRARSRSLLDSAECLLLMPDLLRYFLCGHRAAEVTIAGSSQLLDIRTRRWSASVLKAYGLPARLLPPLVRPGIIAGPLLPDAAAETKVGPVPVMVVVGHDTASAAAAAPFADADTVFLSSGTWSVLGLVLPTPHLSEQARAMGFINETGLDSVLFVKNLTGLYLVENLKRQWSKRGQEVTYAAMIKAAAHAPPFRFFVDMNAPLFFATDDVETAVGAFLRSTRQRGTPTAGELVRALLESLAFSYRQALGQLQQLTGRSFKRICVVGGGVQNKLLCQWTADATGLEVLAGPVEATVLGNLGAQALATGRLRTPAGIRTMVRNSFAIKTYRPRDATSWDRQAGRYLALLETSRKLPRSA